jgi:hypothetical protein
MKRVQDTLYDIIDTYTGENFNYSKVTTFADGSAMDDTKADGVIYRKLGNEYFKRNFNGTVNVNWFGAKGDGIHDDTLAIQKALDCGIKNIHFPPGQFLLTSPLLIKNNPNSFGLTITGSKAQTYLLGTPGMECIIDVLKGGDGALSLTLDGLRFSAEGAFTGWAIRALGTGTLIDSIIQKCWFGTGSLSMGSFYGKTVYSSFINNVHELNKVFAHCTLASLATFSNNKFFDTFDEMFYFESGNGIIINGSDTLMHRRGSFIKAKDVDNLNVSNINYIADTELPDSGHYCKFAELDNVKANFSNCRVISNRVVGGYADALKVSEAFNIKNSEVLINNFSFDSCDYIMNISGNNQIKISNSTVNKGTWGFNFNALCEGTFKMDNVTIKDLGYRPLSMPSLHSTNIIITNNQLINSCRAIATYVWYIYTNGTVDFKNNLCELTDNLTQWFSIDKSSIFSISQNTFKGIPTLGFIDGDISNCKISSNTGIYQVLFNNSIPINGTYNKGDKIINSNPIVGNPKGWICTLSGTPGTWVSEGNL